MARNIEVVLELDNKKFNRQISQSEKTVDNFSKKSTSGFINMRSAFVALAGAISIREIAQLSDEFNNLNNRLVAVTGDVELAASGLDLVRQVAADSRSDISSVASLFADLTVATRDLGTSQTDIAEVTRVFAQTLKISGADAGAAAGAIRQFGQALASGTLRGDEFNSIAESNSFFMLQLAESLGKPLGELRELARQGKLTADVVLSATKDMADRVADDFSNTSITIGDSFVALRNSFINLVGAIESETGVFAGVAESIQSLADAINGINVSIDSLKKGFIAIISVAALFLNPFGLIAGVIGTVVRGVTLLISRFKFLRGALSKGSEAASNFFGVFKSRVKDLFGFGTEVTKQSTVLAGHAKNADLAIKGIGGIASAATTAIVATKLLNSEMENFVGPPEPPGLRKTDPKKDPVTPVVLPEKELTKIQQFEKSLQDLLVTEKNFKDAMARLNEEFSTDTVGNLSEYNQALRAIQSAFPEQAEALRELIKLQEEKAEQDRENLANLEEGRKAIDKFTEGFTGQMMSTEELNRLQAELNALLSKYPELADAVSAAQDRLNEAYSDNEGLNNFLDTLGTAQKTLSEDLANAFIEGEKAGDAFKSFFKKMVSQLIADIIRLQIIQPILGALLSPFGFAFGAGGSIVPKQTGGPVMPGGTYLVGEKGPELLHMGAAGTITPNSQMGGGQVTYNINAVDAPSFQALVASDPGFIYAVTQAGARTVPGSR